MTDLATNVVWGTSPTNRFNFAYEHERAASTMRYKLQINCAPCSGSSYFGYPIYLEISLDGKVLDTHTLKAASPRQWSEKISYTTGWLEVSKATGTTALVIRIYSGSGSSRNVKYSYSLPVIATASTVSATDANIGRTCSIIISRVSSTLRHTLSYKFDGQSSFTTIVSKTAEAVASWTVPTSAYSLIPDMPSILCTIKCDTYSGDTLVGSSECQMIASASASTCAPSVSATAIDADSTTVAVTGNSSVVVKGRSDLKVTVSASAKNSATIKKITVVCGDKSADATSGSVTINNVESATVVVTAKDSRGFSTTYTVPGLTLVEYTPCWIVPEITRPDPTGDSITLSITGQYFDGAIGQMTNTATVQWRTKPSGGDWSAWASVNATVSGGTINAEQSFSGFDYTASYNAQVRVADKLGSSTKAITIMQGMPIFDWGKDALGNLEFTFNVPINGRNGSDGYTLDINTGAVIRNGLMLLGGELNVSAHDGVSIRSFNQAIYLDGAEIYLNMTPLSTILEKLGLT